VTNSPFGIDDRTRIGVTTHWDRSRSMMIRIEIGFDGMLKRVIRYHVARLNFMIDQVDQRPASCDATGELNAIEKPPAVLRRRQKIIVDDGGVTRLTATEPNVSD